MEVTFWGGLVEMPLYVVADGADELVVEASSGRKGVGGGTVKCQSGMGWKWLSLEQG